MPNNNERILNLLSLSADGVIGHVENSLYELRDEGQEITRSEIQGLVASSVETHLTEMEWHLQEALKVQVQDQINIEDLLEEYSQPRTGVIYNMKLNRFDRAWNTHAWQTLHVLDSNRGWRRYRSHHRTTIRNAKRPPRSGWLYASAFFEFKPPFIDFNPRG